MVISSFLGGAAAGGTVAIVIKAVDQYSKELKKAQKSIKGTSKEVNQLSIAMRSFGKTAALAAAAGLASFGLSATRAAIQMEPMKRGFEDLTEGSQGFLMSLEEATKGTVSQFELMRSANQALLLGIDQDKLPELFRGAAIIAQAAGRTTTEAIQDISTGIGRQSRVILDNLGIIVDSQKAYDDYAASIGKATEELSEQEKFLAFQAASIEAVRSKVEDLGGELEETTTVHLERFKKAWADLQISFGGPLKDAFDVVLKQITRIIEGLAFLPDLITIVGGKLRGFSDEEISLLLRKDEILAEAREKLLGPKDKGTPEQAATQPVDEFAEILEKAKKNAMESTEAVAQYNNRLAKLQELLATNTISQEQYDEALEIIQKDLQEVTSRTMEAATGFRRLASSLDAVNESTRVGRRGTSSAFAALTGARTIQASPIFRNGQKINRNLTFGGGGKVSVSVDAGFSSSQSSTNANIS